LSKKTGQVLKIKESKFFKAANLALSRFNDLKNVCEESLKRLANKEMILSITQREFPIHHILKSPNGYLAIDWEHAREEYPPIFDFFSLLLSEERNIPGSYEERFIKNVKQTFFQENKEHLKEIKGTLDYYNLSKIEAYHFFILYILDQALIANETGASESTDRLLKVISKIEKGELNKKDWLLLIQK